MVMRQPPRPLDQGGEARISEKELQEAAKESSHPKRGWLYPLPHKEDDA